ncbi:MAG TPA: ABC transporter permease [Bryobacteraceae bacterium]|nr:ABC transporter permease [Bryobacteraceae bacterium]
MAASAPSFRPIVARPRSRWTGDYLFLIQNLILKDIRVRYRNMSLGVLWSLLNPLVMMGVLWFVFTKIYDTKIPHFAVFALCGLVPYNVFTLSWLTGTTSLVESATLIKRVPVPREIIPISAVLGNCVHMSCQLVLLLLLVALTFGGVNRYWIFLPVVWFLEILFVVGLALISAGLNVYVRDVRYVVESANLVLFWLVPIFYPLSMIPMQFREIYRFNPVAALVLASQRILVEGVYPQTSLLLQLAASSILVCALGFVVFRKLRTGFYNYL